MEQEFSPIGIMAINMVLVFGVLMAIWLMIEITHMIDPTKKSK